MWENYGVDVVTDYNLHGVQEVISVGSQGTRGAARLLLKCSNHKQAYMQILVGVSLLTLCVLLLW